MITGILTAKTALQYTSAFQCNPFVGTMQLPLVMQDPSKPIGEPYMIVAKPLTADNCDDVLTQLALQVRLDTGKLGNLTQVALPFTHNLWTVTQHSSGATVFDRRNDAQPWNSIMVALPEPGDPHRAVGFMKLSGTGESATEMRVARGYIEDPRGFFYTLSFHDNGIIGLKKFFGLSDDAPHAKLLTSLIDLLDVKDLSITHSSEVPDPHNWSESGELNTGQNFVLNARDEIQHSSRNVKAAIEIEIEPSYVPGMAYLPLPQQLRGLWALAAQANTGKRRAW